VLTSGTPKIYIKTAESGNKRTRLLSRLWRANLLRLDRSRTLQLSDCALAVGSPVCRPDHARIAARNYSKRST